MRIPVDAIAVAERAFADANRVVSERMCRMPNVWETSLDQALIEAIAAHSGPVKVGSGWTVRIETHFLGGGRHFGNWEIADLGVLVVVRERGVVRRSKVGLLQSKRLYPVEVSMDEAERYHFESGIFRLWESEELAVEASKPGVFRFSKESEYKQLLAGDDQIARIREFEELKGANVEYLLYNPMVLPWEQAHPLVEPINVPAANRLGCRVVASSAIREFVSSLNGGSSPNIGGLQSGLPSPYSRAPSRGGRTLESYISRLIACKEGYSFSGDDGIISVFGRRTGPIAAGIGLTFEAPG
jgi:hypothetical protein